MIFNFKAVITILLLCQGFSPYLTTVNLNNASLSTLPDSMALGHPVA